MNSLSWFIYATQVSQSVGEASAVFAILLGIGMLFAGIFCAAAKHIDDMDGPLDAWKRAIRWVAPSFIVLVLLGTLMPTRQTMLLIAGSEIGHRLVASENVQSVFDPAADLLREWIKAETDRLRGKK